MNRVAQIYELLQKHTLPDVANDICLAVQATEYIPFETEPAARSQILDTLNLYLFTRCKRLIEIADHPKDTKYTRTDRVAMHQIVEYACRHVRDMVEELAIDPPDPVMFYDKKW